MTPLKTSEFLHHSKIWIFRSSDLQPPNAAWCVRTRLFQPLRNMWNSTGKILVDIWLIPIQSNIITVPPEQGGLGFHRRVINSNLAVVVLFFFPIAPLGFSMFTKPWRSFRNTIILGVSNIKRPLRLGIVSWYSIWHWNQVKHLSFTSQKSPCVPKISTLWPRCSGVVAPTRAWIPCCFRKTTMSSWVPPRPQPGAHVQWPWQIGRDLKKETEDQKNTKHHM